MKRVVYLLFISVIFFRCASKIDIEQLKLFAPIEQYPDDIFLDTVSNKRALVIVAHDDDDCAMSGTIAKLTSNGWAIKSVSLQNHILSSTGKNPSDIICQGNELLLDDRYYRKGLDTMKTPYLPITYEQMKEQFLSDKISNAIIQKVSDFEPSVIFTLDNEKGGYGHPEHIYISHLVKELFEQHKIEAKKIYQSVYTNSMETEIVDKWLGAKMKKWNYPDPSKMANELYHIDGMPEPTVQIYITDVAETKMKYLRIYEENVRKNLRKFIPYYEEFDAATYFNIFDREFFRIIEKPNR
ncbi:MAG TPA: PIG-L family deacetylase [Niabella sp.]|nr:PIG-L family deacetylase [Niabella sp.]